MFAPSRVQERIHTLSTPPTLNTFTPLPEHEAQTPASFYDGPPVLHAHHAPCDVLLAQRVLDDDNFRVLGANAERVVAMDGFGAGMKLLKDVEVWVSSELLLLTVAQSTLAIPYPAISLHATHRLRSSRRQPHSGAPTETATDNETEYVPFGADADQAHGKDEVGALYLQIDAQFAERGGIPLDEDGDDDVDAFEVYLVPLPAANADTGVDGIANGSGTSNAGLVRDLFEALSRCSDLHPDEDDEDDEDDGPAPGLGGWITADNMHEFRFADPDVDEQAEGGAEGVNGENGLGPGAGTRRMRADGDGVNGLHGDDAGDDVEDDTKWQRTG